MTTDHQDTDTTILDTDVLVVGAGPAGLMLATELRLGGAEVVVVDQRPGPTTESRASTLHARTMEILDSRGLLDELGTPPCEPRGHFGGVPLDLTLPSPHPGQWKVAQTRTEELLQRRAAVLGADLRRRHQLLSLTAEDGVEAEAIGPYGPVRIRARYLVGCDGEDSTVRRLVRAPFPGKDAARELLRADVSGVEVADRRFQRLEHGLAIAATREGVTRVMVHEFGRPAAERGGAEPDFAEVTDVWKRVTGEDISQGTPLWVNAFGDANRQLAHYRHGRVLFAGDAAHRQMPSGGQALNLGVQDAFNLGWKLAAVVRGSAGEDLLDSYHSERHTVGRQVLANIRAQVELLLGGPEVEPARALLTELVALDGVRQHLAGMISGLGIRYDVEGPEIDSGAHPLLGRRLPDAWLEPAERGARRRTTELLRTGRGLLLSLDGDGAPALRATAAPWSDRVAFVADRPAAGGPLPTGQALLVRPDGYVAWAGSGPAGLARALTRWFGTLAADD
ncbi:FAD-dependent monooxygenase [Streptomyces olivochromogenes]|uniref:Putative oxygenase n=1 Tax=Streptomyces olivochromogenes TaxID=1963 RepID=A0A250VVB6_STROL|nr:FAD-dependent monooxygenase [Streptomyces olivochromogenes]KUN35289.1 oxidoreductase [Streptomyces olivochromogenes]GAX58019.1 putative oxygenase [Streptomyces olivochromogenes]